MSKALIAAFASAILVAPVVHAQDVKSAPAPPAALAPVTLTGCVSAKPETSGQYIFAEADGIREYRLNGKGIRKFAGRRVELVGGTSGGGNGLSVRGGLWPAPSGGARGVALDPAQEAIAHQPGGNGAPRGEYPEFRVTRLRPVEGVCEATHAGPTR
jgi:hypothetical protein